MLRTYIIHTHTSIYKWYCHTNILDHLKFIQPTDKDSSTNKQPLVILFLLSISSIIITMESVPLSSLMHSYLHLISFTNTALVFFEYQVDNVKPSGFFLAYSRNMIMKGLSTDHRQSLQKSCHYSWDTHI